MSPAKRYAKKQAKASNRRRHQAHERLRRDQTQAQRALEALEQALHDLGLPDNLVKEIEGRLRRQQKLLGKSLVCCSHRSLAVAPRLNSPACEAGTRTCRC